MAPAVVRRPVKAIVRAALANRRIRRIVEAELARARERSADSTRSPGAHDAVRVPETFVDGRGVAHALDPTLRDRLKPGWRSMLDPDAARAGPTDDAILARVRAAALVAEEARAVIEAATGRALRGRILEVGTYDGAVAQALATLPSVEVVASDLVRYYVVQLPGEIAEDAAPRQAALLDRIRERVTVLGRHPASRVTFVEDDVTRSALPPGTFDAVVSFEVLEHVRDPEAALSAIARLLVPGGVSYHVYNPFFSLTGGHSLCTLDFRWGHARLSQADVERYLKELRPAESGQAIRFYEESLNRMTLADLHRAIAASGLEEIAVIPWHDRSLAKHLGPEVIEDVRRGYPTAAIDDLTATFVTVVLGKPG